jgi:hypothetical protein
MPSCGAKMYNIAHALGKEEEELLGGSAEKGAEGNCDRRNGYSRGISSCTAKRNTFQ